MDQASFQTLIKMQNDFEASKVICSLLEQGQVLQVSTRTGPRLSMRASTVLGMHSGAPDRLLRRQTSELSEALRGFRGFLVELPTCDSCLSDLLSMVEVRPVPMRKSTSDVTRKSLRVGEGRGAEASLSSVGGPWIVIQKSLGPTEVAGMGSRSTVGWDGGSLGWNSGLSWMAASAVCALWLFSASRAGAYCAKCADGHHAVAYRAEACGGVLWTEDMHVVLLSGQSKLCCRMRREAACRVPVLLVMPECWGQCKHAGGHLGWLY